MGGKGANQAVAAARLGAHVTLVGCVGRDAFGEELRSGVQQAGVNVHHIAVLPQVASGIALIAVEASGQNTIIIAPGANGLLSAEAVAAARDAIGGAKVLLLQLETPLATVQRAAELAREVGTTVILNPAPAQALPTDLLRHVDFLIPNEHEAATLLGESYPNADANHTALRLRDTLGVRNIIITLGAHGAVLVNAESDTAYHFPPHTVEVVDTTAAGDAFMGAFAVALADDYSLDEAVRWGNAAGALAVTCVGAQPSLPTRSQLTGLL